MRPLAVLVATVTGFAALLHGLLGDGPSALASLALALGLLNTAALLPRDSVDDEGAA